MNRLLSVLGFPDVRNVPVCIYALTDPDGSVRYIGKSVNPTKRLSSHMSRSAASPVYRWASFLRSHGLRPGLRILHVVPPGQDADAWETWFLREYRLVANLLNACFEAEWCPRIDALYWGERWAR